ncbi:hypothetical protein CL622_02965 [archaeon]|nr:hypothetical protein [archaeon]|tara:strand:- start:86 stop:400 length:315 start_codon:yes stop_codon:yes gene_type:complete
MNFKQIMGLSVLLLLILSLPLQTVSAKKLSSAEHNRIQCEATASMNHYGNLRADLKAIGDHMRIGYYNTVLDFKSDGVLNVFDMVMRVKMYREARAKDVQNCHS